MIEAEVNRRLAKLPAYIPEALAIADAIYSKWNPSFADTIYKETMAVYRTTIEARHR